jgi:hypothetical protein
VLHGKGSATVPHHGKVQLRVSFLCIEEIVYQLRLHVTNRFSRLRAEDLAIIM